MAEPEKMDIEAIMRRWKPDFIDNDPHGFLFPALNLHTDEISCGIGLVSLGRLQDTIMRQTAFWRGLLGLVILLLVLAFPGGIVGALGKRLASRGKLA